jgi:hypothetical protein
VVERLAEGQEGTLHDVACYWLAQIEGREDEDQKRREAPVTRSESQKRGYSLRVMVEAEWK